MATSVSSGSLRQAQGRQSSIAALATKLREPSLRMTALKKINMLAQSYMFDTA